MKLTFMLSTLGLLASYVAADGATPITDWPLCPENVWMCDSMNGAFCVDRNAGGWCCDDGSGGCGKGFKCGTDVAINRCCPDGITMQQCADAIVANVATTVAPTGNEANRGNNPAGTPAHKRTAPPLSSATTI